LYAYLLLTGRQMCNKHMRCEVRCRGSVRGKGSLLLILLLPLLLLQLGMQGVSCIRSFLSLVQQMASLGCSVC
jgi:hypothetical protein